MIRSTLRAVAVAAILAVPFASVTACSPDDTSVSVPGDDNLDGYIDEDESGWNCKKMGNKKCGKSRH